MKKQHKRQSPDGFADHLCRFSSYSSSDVPGTTFSTENTGCPSAPNQMKMQVK
jgi:hypothetical protein